MHSSSFDESRGIVVIDEERTPKLYGMSQIKPYLIDEEHKVEAMGRIAILFMNRLSETMDTLKSDRDTALFKPFLSRV